MSDLLSKFQPLVLLVLTLGVMFFLRGGFSRRRRSVNDAAETQREMRERLKSSQAQLEQHQLQLHDIARDAQASLQSRLTTLDQMVIESDREIARLEALLREIRELPSPRLKEREAPFEESLPPEDVAQVPAQESDQFIRLMFQAGFSAAEIARGLNQSESRVREALDDQDEGQARAA